MIRHPCSYRDRTINALATLVGDDGEEQHLPRLSRALVLPRQRLAITAGDERTVLNPYALKAAATERGLDIVATWTDKMLSGHQFEIDVVLHEGDGAVHHQALRLWAVEKRGAFLLAPSGEGTIVSIDARGLTPIDRPPFRSKADLTIGIASGQALLQRLTFVGSPFATPLPHNLGR